MNLVQISRSVSFFLSTVCHPRNILYFAEVLNTNSLKLLSSRQRKAFGQSNEHRRPGLGKEAFYLLPCRAKL